MTPDLVVMDWGIGGLSVYNEIRRLSPELSIVYYSDAGQMPYGKMPAAQLANRLREIIFKFADEGVEHFVVACNAASTMLPGLEKDFRARGLAVEGVIEHGIQLIRKSKKRKVGVIGGARTIRSGQFTKPFKTSSQTITGRVAQPLSALIESGKLNGPEMERALKKILAPLKNCEALVLACTHYPAVAPQIQSLLPRCRLLDPARATARFVRDNWKFKPRDRVNPKQLCMTSGQSAQMIRAARLAFGTRISRVLEV